MSDRLIAAIRTAVAALVATWIVWATDTFGLDLDSAAIEIAVLGVVTAVYNAGVNWLATRWPHAGYLLGVPRTPTYTERR